ncbi:N-acetylneuraminate synthase family protein, partial [Bradyrhizobium sp. NBAIM08]|uniref:N-acetylneuraminate synthase family protein n=1 Tax=Bradyrhizobium sp. NBAIM08 TaxID=2793815 RepID=UPI001CD782A8
VARAAATHKPLIISTGMANSSEIAAAIDSARAADPECKIVLLHCVSGYPTPAEEANLLRIPALAREFGVPVGLSDHTLGIEVAIAAVALGAAVIEKHLTLSRGDGGPDAAFSLEPSELRELVQGARKAHLSLGRGDHGCAKSEAGNRVFRRSLYV